MPGAAAVRHGDGGAASGAAGDLGGAPVHPGQDQAGGGPAAQGQRGCGGSHPRPPAPRLGKAAPEKERISFCISRDALISDRLWIFVI